MFFNLLSRSRRRRSASPAIAEEAEQPPDRTPQLVPGDDSMGLMQKQFGMYPDLAILEYKLTAEGLSTEEVAHALGCTEATVRSQICKARVKVKGFVERYFGRRL